jgi:hypothetical protein
MYRSYIESALEHADGEYTFEDVRDAVASGKAQFWPAPHAVIITELQTFPRAKHCHVWLAAGDFRQINAMIPPLHQWAVEQGCTKATISGRRGWIRKLAPQGWHESPQVRLEKALI